MTYLAFFSTVLARDRYLGYWTVSLMNHSGCNRGREDSPFHSEDKICGGRKSLSVSESATVVAGAADGF